jgi:hypothetical protein
VVGRFVAPPAATDTVPTDTTPIPIP